MKKILFMMMMLLVISGSCFAKGVSPVFAAGEKTCDSFVEGVVGSSSYSSLSGVLAPDFKKEFSADAYGKIREGIAKELGSKASSVSLIGFSRSLNVNDGTVPSDTYAYFCTFPNDKFALLSVVVVNDGGYSSVVGFNLSPLERNNK